MDKLKKILKKAGVVQRLRLATKAEGEAPKGTGPHRVEILGCKIVTGRDYQTGEERPEVKLLLKEEGEKKSYNFPVKSEGGSVHYLVERFADLEPGDEVVLEYKRKGKRGFIDIQKVGQTTDVSETGPEDIPVIEEDEYDEEPPESHPEKY